MIELTEDLMNLAFLLARKRGTVKEKSTPVLINNVTFIIKTEEISNPSLALVTIFNDDKKQLTQKYIQPNQVEDFVKQLSIIESNGRPFIVNFLKNEVVNQIDKLLFIPVEFFIDYPDLLEDIKHDALRKLYKDYKGNPSLKRLVKFKKDCMAIKKYINSAEKKIMEDIYVYQEQLQSMAEWLEADKVMKD